MIPPRPRLLPPPSPNPDSDPAATLAATTAARLEALASDFDRESVEQNNFRKRVDAWFRSAGQRIDQSHVAAAKAQASAAAAATQSSRVANEIADLGSAVIRLESSVGLPPADPEKLARASQHDMTPEQIAALETGTGLHGRMGRVELRQTQSERRLGKAGLAAVGIGALAQQLPTLLDSLGQAAGPASMGLVVIALGIIYALMARAQKDKS